MTKRDIIVELAAQMGWTLVFTTRFVNLVFQQLIDAVLRHDRIELRGLGSWHLRRGEAFNHVIPTTRKIELLDARYIVVYRPGKLLTRELLQQMKAREEQSRSTG